MPETGVDWMMTSVTDMIVSCMMLGSGWVFTYEDRIQRRSMIAADYVE